MERQKALLQELMATAKDMLRNTEIDVRSYMMFRPRFLHSNTGGASNAAAPSQAPGATTAPGSGFQPTAATMVESIHQYIQSMKTAYLADHRGRGDVNDPFLEADRRETAKQEAAAKRVHPTLHLPTNSQPSTQVAGLLPGSATIPAAASAPQTSAAPSTASWKGGLSLFSTPSSTPASSMSSSLFATRTTRASTQNSLFSSSSRSFFGSSSTPSIFSSTTPAFSSTASAGGSFSIPFASGAPTGSGASFGAASVSKIIKVKVPDYPALVIAA
ncbi:Nuclear pore complex protein NUP58 [Hibiscus syriacus]|uniref:Nuclear pore complex protein NUP58 n=1 Tax=Hibiscus syriacus TaxID=106335 RepID=A0A6A3ABZ2_HIBSY|nr:Nuclear pore complex protein NUP58 [Hibiscus syriacus]